MFSKSEGPTIDGNQLISHMALQCPNMLHELWAANNMQDQPT